MTAAGFPHSDILGSRFVCQLPEAYRRLLRPSSAPGAKASTLCPYKLDKRSLIKMLASTVQFSSYGRVLKSRGACLDERGGSIHRSSDRSEATIARPLRTQQRAE